jgi:hypothetical protein
LNTYKIGNVWTEQSVSPSSVDISFYTKKCRFFLGDRWLEIGKVNTRTNVRNGGLIMDVDMPDVEGFLIRRLDLNDGTEDWAEWGPRVN